MIPSAFWANPTAHTTSCNRLGGSGAKLDEFIEGPPHLDKDQRVLKAQVIDVEESIELRSIAEDCGMHDPSRRRLMSAIHMHSRGRSPHEEGQAAVEARDSPRDLLAS
jgi:hypothetical protein